VSKKLERLG